MTFFSFVETVPVPRAGPVFGPDSRGRGHGPPGRLETFHVTSRETRRRARCEAAACPSSKLRWSLDPAARDQSDLAAAGGLAQWDSDSVSRDSELTAPTRDSPADSDSVGLGLGAHSGWQHRPGPGIHLPPGGPGPGSEPRLAAAAAALTQVASRDGASTLKFRAGPSPTPSQVQVRPGDVTRTHPDRRLARSPSRRQAVGLTESDLLT